MILTRGQSLVDLALILMVAALAFSGMQVYVKRGVQGRVQQMTNHILSGEQSVGENGAGTSHSSTTLTSNMELIGFKEGKKSLNGTENSVYDYHTVN
jgi:hypothetical protein